MVGIEVAELVRQRAMANGVAGRRWLEELPGVVGALTDRWDLTLGRTFSGGTAGYVAEASDSSGRMCVLKVAMPLDSDEVDAFHRSVRAHQLAGGRGCVALLNSDPAAAAMLLERLGPNLDELGYSVPQILETIALTLGSFWRPITDDAELPTGGDKAAWLADYIVATWDELGRPCARGVIDQAVAYCDERAASLDMAEAVLVHGDAHGWNTVAATDGRFKFVDPEGLLSERAHDLAVPMREYNEPLLAGNTVVLARQRAEFLAGLCEVDPEAVWQWGFIERVSTGLANVRDFEAEGESMFLEVAARCLPRRTR